MEAGSLTQGRPEAGSPYAREAGLSETASLRPQAATLQRPETSSKQFQMFLPQCNRLKINVVVVHFSRGVNRDRASKLRQRGGGAVLGSLAALDSPWTTRTERRHGSGNGNQPERQLFSLYM